MFKIINYYSKKNSKIYAKRYNIYNYIFKILDNYSFMKTFFKSPDFIKNIIMYNRNKKGNRF